MHIWLGRLPLPLYLDILCRTWVKGVGSSLSQRRGSKWFGRFGVGRQDEMRFRGRLEAAARRGIRWRGRVFARCGRLGYRGWTGHCVCIPWSDYYTSHVVEGPHQAEHSSRVLMVHDKGWYHHVTSNQTLVASDRVDIKVM